MNPVYQTKFGKTEGNCLAACLASIFEIPIESVSDFGLTDLWYAKFEDYMIQTFDLQPVDLLVDKLDGWKPKGYHLINGKSPRGNYDHAVVGLSGEPVHDPFPNGNCELEQSAYTIFVAMLFDAEKKWT